jgi:hypothetical protein
MPFLFFFFLLKGDFFGFFRFMYAFQHCFICRPSYSTVSEDAGIEHRRSNHWARSHSFLPKQKFKCKKVCYTREAKFYSEEEGFCARSVDRSGKFSRCSALLKKDPGTQTQKRQKWGKFKRKLSFPCLHLRPYFTRTCGFDRNGPKKRVRKLVRKALRIYSVFERI